MDAGVSYESSSQALITRARFLLELASAMEDDVHPACDAMVDAVIEAAAATATEEGYVSVYVRQAASMEE